MTGRKKSVKKTRFLIGLQKFPKARFLIKGSSSKKGYPMTAWKSPISNFQNVFFLRYRKKEPAGGGHLEGPAPADALFFKNGHSKIDFFDSPLPCYSHDGDISPREGVFWNFFFNFFSPTPPAGPKFPRKSAIFQNQKPHPGKMAALPTITEKSIFLWKFGTEVSQKNDSIF